VRDTLPLAGAVSQPRGRNPAEEIVVVRLDVSPFHLEQNSSLQSSRRRPPRETVGPIIKPEATRSPDVASSLADHGDHHVGRSVGLPSQDKLEVDVIGIDLTGRRCTSD
jgi:hypothetical protein